MNDAQNIANTLKVLTCRTGGLINFYMRARTYGKGKPLPASREHFQILRRHKCVVGATPLRHALGFCCDDFAVNTERSGNIARQAVPLGEIRMRRAPAQDIASVRAAYA
jgi:hypothetical protein